MDYTFRVVEAPSTSMLQLRELQDHLRADSTDDASEIFLLSIAATEYAQDIARRAFVTQTLEMSFQHWPSTANGFALLRPPVQSVTWIKYTKSDGTQVTLDTSIYKFLANCEPSRVILAFNQMWPADELDVGYPITIRYVAGYGDAAAVPQRYRHAVRLLVGHWFENREGVIVSPTSSSAGGAAIPFAIRSLLTTKRGKY